MITATIVSLLLSQAAPAAAEAPAPAAQAPAPAADAVVAPAERRTSRALGEAIEALRTKYPKLVTVSVLGTSIGKLPIPMLTLSDDAANAAGRPAFLVVAGFEGPRWSAGEEALVAAEKLLRDHAALLSEVTVLVVPRANPDAAERFATDLPRDYSGNAALHDNDRDHKVDENGPSDLNGDGWITQMRLAGSKPPWTKPSLVADGADARLMKRADATKGELPVYTVWTEGIDSDGDGRIAEDWKGGIAVDRNFPHRWPEFEDEAGAYPLITPEAKALADFVIANPRIFAALVIGRHDTVVNAPDGKAKAEGGMPAMIDEADVGAYGEAAKVLREALGLKRASGSDTAGSFVAWMNAQRGVPTFATQAWGRPDVPAKDKDAKDGAKPDAPKADAPKADATKQDAPADAPAGGAAPAGRQGGGGGPSGGRRSGRGGFGGGARAATAAPDAAKPNDEEDAAGLAYSDQMRGGAGFVPWTKATHPQLGEVEVGGWVAGFKDNPPIIEVRPQGEKLGDALAKLAAWRPRVELRSPTVTVLAPNLYRVNLELVNAGRLPTVQRGGRAEGVTPANVVRISTPMDRIRAGRRTDIVRGMDPGEVRNLEWTVSAEPGETVTVDLLFAGQPVGSFACKDGVPVATPADAGTKGGAK
jgi:hypothetical protein